MLRLLRLRVSCFELIGPCAKSQLDRIYKIEQDLHENLFVPAETDSSYETLIFALTWD